ncbi:GerAB/ArcD/ProY family transporter [Clostridium brassicae]|uniref:Endospore germination permease n=1 Tax=Clostridium brassicae TaxID=2999072 RepID=A0ABT4DCX6_9CLOT|nr:endospore germination permease [Clostridium brassicae]MCY6959061.1 endospore germination permease [Clostridium brassicae]
MKDFLTNRQIAFILLGVIMGFGNLELPKNIAEKVGTGAWIAILIATCIACVMVWINTYVSYIYKEQTLYEYGELLLGKTLRTIIVVIYIVFFFVSVTYIVENSSLVIKLTILLKTPLWVICLIYYLITYYAVTKGIRVIARICELYGIVIIVSIIITHLLMFTEGKLINIRPFFYPLEVKSYIKGIIEMVFPFLGMELLSIIPMNEKNEGVWKQNVFMVALIGGMYVLIVESCISVMGVDDIVHYNDALLAVIRRIDISYLELFKRLDGIFIISWIMGIFSTLVIYSYGTSYLLSNYFKKTNINFLTGVILMISFVITILPKRNYIQMPMIVKIIKYLGVFCTVIVPIILFIITKVKKYDEKI